MLRAMDIADFIIVKRIEAKNPITNLELQRYLYLVNAKFLFEKGEPLFSEPIEKWKFGPVVGEVYRQYRHFKGGKITKLSDHETYRISNKRIVMESHFFDENSIPNSIKVSIEESINNLSKYTPSQLVEETHRFNEWSNYQEQNLNGVPALIYDQNLLKQYFEEHAEARIW